MGRTPLPTAHDRYIGERIREARMAAGLSQEDLGHMIGLSYQQVQKYESGANRVNGARFERLVTALNRPMSYFFPNATEVKYTPPFSAFLSDRHGQDVAKTWPALTIADRALVLTLVKRLAREQ